MGVSSYAPTGISHTTSVDFSKRNISQPVHIVQYDKSLPILAVSIYNNGQLYPLPSDAVVKIRFGKPDKTFVYNPALGCDSTRTIVYFEITEQMTVFDGEFYPVVEIIRDKKVANSSKIYIIVDKNPIQNDYIESMTEFKELVEYRDEAKAAATEAKTSEKNAKTSETNASMSASAAKASETNAKTSEANAKTSETNAKNSANSSAASASAAKTSETNAANSASAAKNSEANAAKSATNAKTSETNASKSETNAKTSETNAKTSETNTKTSETNAKTSETNASKSASEASTSASAARESETNAKTSETSAAESARLAGDSADTASAKATESTNSAEAASNSASAAKTSETNAAKSETNAKTSETNAKASETNAKTSETNVKTSETNAKTSETNASVSASKAKESEKNIKNSETICSEYAQMSKSYAVGDTSSRENENADNAKYYYEQARQISSGLAGALLPMGTITFAQLAVQSKEKGYMYNISDAFTSDDTFKDGGSIRYPAGTNVYYTADGFWDCIAGNTVTGIKGEAETSFHRNGDVTITPAAIGAYSKSEANAKDKLSGFVKDTTGFWGSVNSIPKAGKCINRMNTPNGGGILFSEHGALVDQVIDGKFYQDEGRYVCLDANNFSAYALPLTGGTVTGQIHQHINSGGDGIYDIIDKNGDKAGIAVLDSLEMQALKIGTASDADIPIFPIYIGNWDSNYDVEHRMVTLLDDSGNTQFPGMVSAHDGFRGNLDGQAYKALKDSNGNTITSTYAKKTELEDAGGAHIGTSAPSSTKKIWIDTGNGGIIKYYNGSAWTPAKATWG